MQLQKIIIIVMHKDHKSYYWLSRRGRGRLREGMFSVVVASSELVQACLEVVCVAARWCCPAPRPSCRRHCLLLLEWVGRRMRDGEERENEKAR